MKVYKTISGIIIEKENKFFLLNEDWDMFINDDNLFIKIQYLTETVKVKKNESTLSAHEILAPIGWQEIWACGVTYLRSKVDEIQIKIDNIGTFTNTVL